MMLAFCQTSAYSQAVGFKAGINTSLSTIDAPATSLSGNIGYVLGLFAESPVGASAISFRPGVYLNFEKYDLSVLDTEAGSGNLTTLKLPLSFVYSLSDTGEGLAFEAGPVINWILNAEIENQRLITNNFDFGLDLGANYFVTPNFGLGGNFYTGFSNLLSGPSATGLLFVNESQAGDFEVKMKNMAANLTLIYRW
ncbi:outer membrane beta-barrel protein [Flavilitoribacter nigricans]|nr:outer membrane beta-barrel protein [Flavilitoribacter nigricans]